MRLIPHFLAATQKNLILKEKKSQQKMDCGMSGKFAKKNVKLS